MGQRASRDPVLPTDRFLTAIVESSNDAIIGETIDGIIKSWNSAAERLYGYTAEEAIDQHISLIIPADRPLELSMNMERLRQGQRIDSYESVRVRKDGTRCNVSVSISPIYDDTGCIVGAASIGRDINEHHRGERERQDPEGHLQEARRRPEAALAETNAILEIINRTGHLLVAEFDLERLIQAVTDAATSLTGAQFGAFFYNALDEKGEHYTLYAISGVPREAFSQFPVPRNTTLFGPTFRGEGVVCIADVRRDPRFAKNAPYYGLPQGHLPVVSYLAVPVIGREGTVLGGLFFGHHEPGVFDEQAERLAEGLAGQAAVAVENARLFQQAQRELKARTESEERFRTAFNSAAIGMALIDVDGHFMQVNAALCAFLGYTEPELLARTVQDITYPDDLAADLGQMRRLVTGEINAYQMEKRYLQKSGEIVWGHLSSAIVRDASGSPLHYIGQVEDISARKSAEQALEWERYLLHALMANLPDAVYFKDAQHRFIRVNPVAAALYGLDDPDAAVGLTDFDVYPEEQARQFWEDEQPILEAGTPLVNRLEQQAETGEAWRWTLATKVPIVDPEGGISGLVGISRDISDLVRAEGALRESEERFRTAFDNAPIGMNLVALDGQFLQVNAALCQLTGYTEAELLAKTFQEITYPDDVADDLAQAARVLAGEIQTFQMEKRYLRKDGTLFWGRLHTSLVRDEDGTPLHFIGQIEDVTARRAAEVALREAETKYRTLVEQLPAVVYLVANDAPYTPLFYNSYIETLTGETPSEAVARPGHWLEDVHPEDQEWVATADARAANRGKAFQAEYRRRRRDGSYVWVRNEAAPLYDDVGQIIAWQGVVFDISDRKQAEAELRAALAAAQAANQARGAFLDLMSHELRTPLQAILGYSEFLLMAPRDSLTDEQREDLNYIHQGGHRMLTLINQVLDLSRLDADRLDLAIEPVDLRQVLEAVRQDVTPQAEAKGLTVEIVLPPSLPHVTGDPELVRQILLNLAGNAVKFTTEGSISITATPSCTGGVEIAVSDTGIGIPAEALPTIFEAFHQVDSSLTRRHQGTGLGLAIAWKLAERMGGAITVSSEPGVGSTFRFHLPARTPSSSS